MAIQLERLKRDSQELGNLIQKLNQSGKTDMAYRMSKKLQFLENSIMSIGNKT
jgi:hypothetical protein